MNTLNKPLTASSLVFVQMVVIGLPCLYFFNELNGVPGIYTAIAVTYVDGGLLSAWFNQRIIKNVQLNPLKA